MSSFWMPKKQPLYAPMLSSFGGGSIRGFNPGGGSSFPTTETYGLNSSYTYSGWGGTASLYNFEAPLSTEGHSLTGDLSATRTNANLAVGTFGERAVASDYLTEYSILGSGDASTNLQYNGRFQSSEDGTNYYRLGYDTNSNYIYLGHWSGGPDYRKNYNSYPSGGSTVNIGTFSTFSSSFLFGQGGDVLFQSGNTGYWISAGRGEGKDWRESDGATGNTLNTGTFANSMGSLYGACYNPDDEDVIVTSHRNDTVKIWKDWRTSSPTLLASLTTPQSGSSDVDMSCESAFFTKYGDVLVCGAQNSQVRAYLFKRTA